MHRLLLGYLLLTLFCIIVGGTIYLIHHAYTPTDYYHFLPMDHSLQTILSGVRQFDPLALVQLGVLLLMGTPLVQIFLRMVEFFLNGDYLYTLISMVLLAILILSLFFAPG